MTSPLVTTDWLADHLNDPTVKVLDASWHLPQMHRDARMEFESQHIPGAQFYDIDLIATPSTNLPHMAASPMRFADMVGQLGISDTDTIVIYDSVGLFSAARAWWNFRIMGAQNTFVLDGGLPKWLAEHLSVTSEIATPAPATFQTRPIDEAVATAEHVHETLKNGAAQVIDVRPAARFKGETPEPRPGLRSGHMPGSINVPFTELSVNGTLADETSLRAALTKAGIDAQKPVISSCGSGVTAPLLNLALAQLGVNALRVYDGSWAEWGAREDMPVTTAE